MQGSLMPAKFDQPGISFQYPENWRLEEETGEAHKSVTVYSPGGAFWSVTLHPRECKPTDLAEAAVVALKEEYAEVESEQANETIAGHDTIGYDVSFYYLDLISTASVRSLRGRFGTYAVYCQAEDREFDQFRGVFLALTVSLLNGIESPLNWE